MTSPAHIRFPEYSASTLPTASTMQGEIVTLVDADGSKTALVATNSGWLEVGGSGGGGSGSGSGGPVTVTATPVLPFTRKDPFYTWMDFGKVTGPMTLTPSPAGRVKGGSVYARWVADGNPANVPAIHATLKIASGAAVQTDDEVHELWAMWNGREFRGTICRLGENAAIDTTAPTILTIAVTGAHTVQLGADEALFGTEAGYSLVVDGGAPIYPDSVSGTTTRSLVFSETLLAGSDFALSYDAGVGDTVDGSANPLESFTDEDATDSIPPPDSIAPTVTAAYVLDKHSIVLVFSEVVIASSAAGHSFNNGGALSVTALAGSGTDTLKFTVSQTLTSADTVTRTYSSGTGNTVDAANNPLALYTSQAVVNNLLTLTASPTPPTESPAGEWATTSGMAIITSPARKIDSGSSGGFVLRYEGGTLNGTGKSFLQMVGIQANNTPESNWLNFVYGFYSTNAGTINSYKSGGADVIDAAPVDGNLYWLRIIDNGGGTSTIIVRKSTDNGVSWTTICTYGTAIANSNWYLKIVALTSFPGVVYDPRILA